jgi:hypothetical protein
MRIIVETPLGKIESQSNTDITVEKCKNAIETILSADSQYLTIFTVSDTVILGTDILRNSIIRLKQL